MHHLSFFFTLLHLHAEPPSIPDVIDTYGIQVFFEIIDADTYEQLRDYIFRIENVTTSRR